MGLSREMPHFWVYLIRLEFEVEDGRIGVMQRMVAGTAAENKPKSLEQVRNVIRIKHYSSRTEQAYVDSISASSFSMANVTPLKWVEVELTKSEPRLRDSVSYLEYNSTMSCSLTIGCISSREGMCATLPLSASRSAVSQSGTGAIWVSSRLRRTSWRDFGLSLMVISSPAFTL